MSAASCDRIGLVEAMFDGRLGPSETASTERHLQGCVACSERRNELVQVREMLQGSVRQPTPLDHQRARLLLLRTATTPVAKRRRRFGLLVLAVLAGPVAVFGATSLSSLIDNSSERPAPRQPAPAVGSRQPQRRSASAALSAREDEPAAPAAEPVPSAAPERAEAAPRPSSRPAAPSHSVSSGVGAVASAPHEVIEKSSPEPSPVANQSPASRDFAAAMQALSRGDFGSSIGQLRKFESTYSRDPRVEDAVYLEAIALERAGRLPEARSAARRYLAAYPSGAHRAQALRITND